ncbi:MAG: phage terminase large subunit family protein [Cetobacterium sp.]
MRRLNLWRELKPKTEKKFIEKMTKAIKENMVKKLLMNIVLWADTYRRLSGESSAEEGDFKISRTPYLKEPLEKFTEDGVAGIVLMLGSQLGKSETLNNIVGWIIHINQCPTMLVQPTETLAEEYSKERITPMLRDTPVLANIMKNSRDNSIKFKAFPGGFLSFRGTGAANKLASKPICIALCDEIDRFIITKEGDPITLIKKRLQTFKDDARLFLSGTPTIKGRSPIENEYLNSTQGEWYIPCPECGEYTTFSWDRMNFTEDGENEPTMQCPICETRNTEDIWKANGQKDGKWVHKDLNKKMYGYKLSGLASPWTTWKKIVAEYLEKKNDIEKLKAFYNTVLAETWDLDYKEVIGHEELFNRRERYDELPEEVAVIALAIDCQDNWFQLEYVGYGRKMESWGLGSHKIMGNLSETSTWEKLDAYINKTFTNSRTGRTLGVEITVIDTGGHYTDEAYDFISPRQDRAVYGIKGIGGNRPGFNGSKMTKCGRINLISFGVNNLKSTVYARLLIGKPGEGYCHFSSNPKDGYDEEFFKSLTGEAKKINKLGNIIFEKIRPRNENLDIRAYIIGALMAAGIDEEEIERILNTIPKTQEKQVEIYKGEIDI